ncbi:FG-GAP-like repeat-containing protein [Coprobacter sp.]
MRIFNLKTLFILFSFLLAGTLISRAAEWQMKKGPMMTPWSETLDPNNVLSEYPRPQMVRSDWMNLNGIWDLRKGTVGEAYSAAFDYDKKILVPFPIESAISGVMEKSDEQCYWYRRTVVIPESMKGKNILLHFGAVDWETVVYVNGTKVGTHTGGYDPFSFDITSALKDGGEQEIAVYIYDNTGVQGQPTGKQSKNPSICWYTAVSGIWQTVWLEPVNPVYIKSFTMEPNLDRAWLSLMVNPSETDGVTVNAKIKDKAGKVVATLENGVPGNILRMTIENVHPWSVEDPYLYDLDIAIVKNGVETDAVKSYCGIRKIEVKKVGDIPRIFLNNKQVFQMGPLDQGWWPDGLYTAPSDEALLFDIRTMKDLGFNMVRKHIKTEPARWYYHCDREGILVWQDLPSPNLPKGHEDFAKANFEDESKRIIDALKNYPSIVQWIVFNEGWGQFDTERMTNVVDTKVNSLTPARFGKPTLICCASGWTDAEVGNIIDTHSYPDPSCPSNANRAAVCGEYGGITLKVPGHIWPGGDFQYTTVETGRDFTAFFNSLCDKIKDYYYQGLNAAVYTQISDVEIEKNGILTYDRRVLKPYSPTGELKAKIEECINMPENKVIIKPILSTAKDHKYTWRYNTTTDVPRRWFAKEYDDRAWSKGLAAFGAGLPEQSADLVSTEWKTSQIYMRRWFYLGDITPEIIDKLRFVLFHDDDIEIYINGVWAATKTGCVFNYVPKDISEEAKNALKPNSWNLIAVGGKQGGGQQIMDIGISAFVTEDFGYTENYDDLESPEYSDIANPGTVITPKFVKLAQPVPGEPAQSGNGTATAAGEFYHTSDRSNVAWGDFDNDGKLEIVYSGNNEHLSTSQQKSTLLYKYAGNDVFERKESPFDACYYACPVWFDYNNDGLLDLFVPGLKNKNYSNDLNDVAAFLYENKGKGQDGSYIFEEVNKANKSGNQMGIYPIYNDKDGGRSRQWVSVGDYDKDGYLDIVVTGRDDYEDPDGMLAEDNETLVYHDRRVVYLYKNNKGKGFIRQETPLNGTEPFLGLSRGSVHFADMDNDGWLDIVSSGYGPNEGNLHIYWNNGDGTFSETGQHFYGSYDSSCSLGDLNADGYMDIVVTGFSRNKGGGSAKSFFVYKNCGNRSFEMLNDSFCGFEGVDGATPSLGDVNHDGLPDILVSGHGSKHEITTWLYLNKGDFYFESYGAYYDDPFGKVGSFDRISHGNNHLVDYNNDGYLDAWNMGWAQESVCPRSCATQLWKNNSADKGIASNEAPSAPKNLKCSYDKNTRMVTFTWDAAVDDVTPASALQYNLYLRKAGSSEYFMTVPADPATGFIKVAEISGQIMTTSYSMYVPEENVDYEWGVQAIDNGKRGGQFAKSEFNPMTTGLKKKEVSFVNVYASNGNIYYNVGDEAILKISDATASLITTIKVKGEGVLENLNRGIYFVSLIMDKTIKVFKLLL